MQDRYRIHRSYPSSTCTNTATSESRHGVFVHPLSRLGNEQERIRTFRDPSTLVPEQCLVRESIAVGKSTYGRPKGDGKDCLLNEPGVYHGQ